MPESNDTAPHTDYNQELVKQIAGICLALRKHADFFQNTEPENLSNEDFDRIAEELELLARSVDDLLDAASNGEENHD